MKRQKILPHPLQVGKRILGVVGLHRAGEAGGWGEAPRKHLLNLILTIPNAWLNWACQRFNHRIVKRIIKTKEFNYSNEQEKRNCLRFYSSNSTVRY